MSFTSEEADFIRAQFVVRMATVGPRGQPDAVPLAFEFDGEGFWIGGIGAAVLRTRKFRNIAENDRVALVFDDIVAMEPFTARCLRVYGRAGAPIERVGMVGPGIYSYITPTVSWSWNMAGEPAGASWYEPRKAVHRPGG
ncbi:MULTISPECIES: PPOX class F420-dependent oxidoreductase [Nocardia]|uniref:PPOX class F420-dependent oxidoreductase n=1 Tax=Nocardia TaxID=1817 RepID=UPI000D699121|nr:MULTISPECIES: PPOX class F420-dependent oxidoreductase [Nocardia]